MRVPTIPANVFFLRKKIPASHRVRGGTPTVSLALGDNREGKERDKGKASRIQSSRIGSALVCVCRNVQHRELKLLESTRFALITAVMVAVPTGSLASHSPSISQNVQSHEKSHTSHRAQGVSPTIILALGANPEGMEKVKGKASRIQSSRIESALVCVRRNVHHLGLKLLESTRSVLNTILMVAVSTCGPTGCPVGSPPYSCQNIQSHEKFSACHRARGETPTIRLALGANIEGKERVKGRASRIQSSRVVFVLVCVRQNAQHLELKLLEST